MFKDYYAILNIEFPSNAKEIKSAYRKQSLKWHPDKNIGQDTEEEMKDINEAYNILFKPDSKQRYDNEYIIFKRRKKTRVNTDPESIPNVYKNQSSYSSWEYDYNIKDEHLKNDINNARKSAEEYVRNFIASLKLNTTTAAKGAWNGALPYIVTGVIMTILVYILQTCS